MEKANLLLDRMGVRGSDKPMGTKFVAVKKLRNGGMVFEMDSELAADWLKKDIRGVFAESFRGLAQIKDRSFQAVVQYVPTKMKDRERSLLSSTDSCRNPAESGQFPEFQRNQIWQRGLPN